MAATGTVPASVHGSWTGYTYWKCKCELCLAAGRAYREARKAGQPNPVPSVGKPKQAARPKPSKAKDAPVRRYRYRIHPSEQAQAQLRRVQGGARFAYNAYIELARDSYAAGARHPSSYDGQKLIVVEGRQATETAWMRELPSHVLTAAVNQAAGAYENFFASVKKERKGPRVGHPHFKKKSHRGAATFDANSFSIAGDYMSTATAPGGRLRLAKVGTMEVNWHRPLPAQPSSVTIIRESDGTWWATFVVKLPQHTPATPTRGVRAAGVDMGLTDFAAIVYTDGTREKVPNPRYLKAAKQRLKRAQQAYSRTKPGSKNREKARVRVARLHSQVANRRATHSRQLAARLTRENQAVAVETLNIRGLARTRQAASIHDAGWGQFLRHLAEAAEKRGTILTRAEAAFPSSRVCSQCGVNSGEKPLNIRVWTCPECGAVLDRDYNAAVNVLVAAGPAVSVNACRGDVRRRLAGAVSREAGTRPSHTGPTGAVEGSRPRGRGTAEAIHERTGHTQPAAHNGSSDSNLEAGR